MTIAEYESDIELTKDTLTGKLWGVCCEDFRENWLRYNSAALYFREKWWCKKEVWL